MKHLLYVGHYTDERREGLRILEADDATGRFREVRRLTIDNAIYMALDLQKKRLYTSFSDPAFGLSRRDGGLASFEIRGDALVKRDAVATGFSTPCYVSLAPDGDALVYAEYANGTAGYAPLTAEGTFAGAPVQVTFADAPGPNKPRQDRPHAHCAVVSPDGRHLHVTDLGCDRIKTYDWRNRAQGLRELPARTYPTTPAGAGPRHLLFHPNGRLAFVVFELGNCVTSYRYADGAFTPIATAPLLPADFTGCSKAAAIHLSEDGTQLFCSNRGHDSLSVFDVDAATGALACRGVLPLGGAFPRDFTFLPGGRILMAGLKMDGVVRTYAYDAARCTLAPIMEKGGFFRPLFFAVGPEA